MSSARRAVSALLFLIAPLAGSVLLVLVLTPLTAGQPTPAYAATFTVTKTADTNDGTCDADCSLREAIGAANALPGLNTIDVPAGAYNLTLARANEDANLGGDLDVTDDLTVNGAGAALTIIDGAGLDRVLDIVSGTVSVSKLTVRNGNSGAGGGIYIRRQGTLSLTNAVVTGNQGGFSGGGIWNDGSLSLMRTTVNGNSSGLGGGIYIWHHGTLFLTDAVVADNHADGSGGGIFNDQGSLSLTRTTVSGNSSYEGGGIRNEGEMTLTSSIISANHVDWSGGGIWNDSDALVADTLVRDNSAAEGGGIAHHGGDLTLDSSTVRGNEASSLGGGIWTDVGVFIAGSLTVIDSTATENTAHFWGGGIFLYDGAVTIEASTISNNTAMTGGGLGAFGADITLTNSTVSGNQATDNGGGIAYCWCHFENVTITDNSAGSFGGGLLLGDPTVFNTCCADAKNTIIAGNTDVSGEAPDVGCDGEGTVFSQGYNIIQTIYLPPPDSAPCLIVGDTTGNIMGQDPLLGPLANNGGPTFTHALLSGSPAIDAGSPDCPPPATDQRGVARPLGWACDIGAFESAFRAPKHKRRPEYLAVGDSTTFGSGASDPSRGYVEQFHDFLQGKHGLKRGRQGVDLLNLSAPGECVQCVAGGQLAPALDELHARNQNHGRRDDVEVITLTWGDWYLFSVQVACSLGVTADCIHVIQETVGFDSSYLDYALGQIRSAAGPKTRILVMTSFNALLNEACPIHFLAPVWDVALEGDSGLGLDEGLNDAVRAIAADYGAEVIETYGLLGPEQLQTDCYNPNDAGHALIAEQFATVFNGGH